MEKLVFETLSKGIIVSMNSSKYKEIASYLSDEENFENFNKIIKRLGFYIVGENGYFYLTKNLKADEEERFFNSHKQVILAVSQLKKVFIHLEKGHMIKKSEFIKRFESKKDEKIINALFDTENIMEITEKFFNLLEKNFVLENIDKDKYLVLNAIDYYFDIVKIISEAEDE
jgi:hypothetical protein